MTELLQRAISEIEKLPEEKQNTIAQNILEELQDEATWAAKFENTSTDQWDKLADLARKDIASGDNLPVETFFSSKKTAK